MRTNGRTAVYTHTEKKSRKWNQPGEQDTAELNHRERDKRSKNKTQSTINKKLEVR